MATKRLYILLLALNLTACNDFLDQQPIADLSSELFWKTPDDAKAGMAGIYDGLQGMLTNNYIDWGEARSDNFKYSGTGEAQINVTLNGLNSTSPQASWDALYRTILRANFAIENLPNITTLSERNRNHYLAQAYAIRALCYFYAVRVWGDVPVWLQPYETNSQETSLARTPASEILNTVIVKDLDTAYTLVDQTIASPVWEVNAGGILAMQADVAMWLKNYPKAIDATDKLIALKRYSLAATADWKKLFTDPASTKEGIWSIYWDYIADGGCGLASRIGSGSNTSQYSIDDALLARFEATKQDIRRDQTYDTTLVTISVDKVWKYYTRNASGQIEYQSTAQCQAKMVMYRYADVLLLRAEALNKSGRKPEAVSLLNQIRTRARLTAVKEADFANERALETAILNERQSELFAEGKRWFDLIRTGRTIEVMDPLLRQRQRLLRLPEIGFGDARKILFPVSRTALNQNSKLTQNPPYSE